MSKINMREKIKTKNIIYLLIGLLCCAFLMWQAVSIFAAAKNMEHKQISDFIKFNKTSQDEALYFYRDDWGAAVDIEKAHDELVEFYNTMKDKKLKRFSLGKIAIDSDDIALEACLGYKGAGIVILEDGTVYIFSDPGSFRGKRFSASWWVWILKGRNNSIYSYMAENIPELEAALQNWSCVEHYTSIAEQLRK